MRNTLLVSTAALLAGLAYASAQKMPEGAQPGGTVQGQQPVQGSPSQAPSQTPSQGQREPSAAQGPRGEGAKAKTKQAQPQRSPEKAKSETAGQGERDQGVKGSKAKDAKAKDTKAKDVQSKSDKSKQAQPQRSQGKAKSDQTTGQSQRDQGAKDAKAKDATSKSDKSKQAQPQRGQSKAKSDQTTGQGQRDRGQAGQQPSQARQDRIDVTLTAEQRTRIRQTVLARRDVPRLTSVNFSINVGTVVPSRVRLVAVPSALIEIRPEFRNHQFFVLHDDIVIVDRSRRIVAVIASGPAQARGSGGSGATGAVAIEDFTVEEIREVQLVLIERGFLVGPADGVFGASTRDALIAFQRQEGIQVSGTIDTRTVTALGVTIRSDRQGAQGTEGRQTAPDRQPSATTGQGSAPGKGSPPATTGQGQSKGQDKQPGASTPAPRQQGGATPPSTTGQGSSDRPQPPASQPAPKASDRMPANPMPQSPGGAAGGSPQSAPAR